MPKKEREKDIKVEIAEREKSSCKRMQGKKIVEGEEEGGSVF